MYCGLFFYFSPTGECVSNSILELWNFDIEEIEKMKTVQQVTDKIHNTKYSPVYQYEFVPTNWLGDVTYDGEGKILRAKAAKMLYVIKATSTNDFNTKIVVM